MREVLEEMMGSKEDKGSKMSAPGELKSLCSQISSVADKMGISSDELMEKVKMEMTGDSDSVDMSEESDEEMPNSDMGGDMSGKKSLIVAMLKKKAAKSSEY